MIGDHVFSSESLHRVVRFEGDYPLLEAEDYDWG